jgi:DNA polymerase-2
VHLYGRLEGGDTFLVRDDRQRPHFYIRAADAGRARELRAPEPRPVEDGRCDLRIEVETPQDIPGLRDRLHAAGIETFEADVRFAVRYLIDRGIKGGCEIEGDWVTTERIARVYSNPTLRPFPVDVQPRVLSFDIETDPQGDRLLAISLYAPGSTKFSSSTAAIAACRILPVAASMSARRWIYSAPASTKWTRMFLQVGTSSTSI